MVGCNRSMVPGIPNSRCFFFQAEDGIRDHAQSRGLGDVYKRQVPETWYHQPSSPPRNRCDVFPLTTTTPHEDIIIIITLINRCNLLPPLHFEYYFALRLMVDDCFLFALGVVADACCIFFSLHVLRSFFYQVAHTHQPIPTYPLLQGFCADAHRFTLNC